MADLSAFAGGRFDLIVHPISNVFVADVLPVWTEAFRVLRPGGVLLAGFMNPAEYLFDFYLRDHEERLEVRYTLPFSSLTSLSTEERERDFGPDAPLEFSHNLEDQIGGQMRAGFLLSDFYEEHRADEIIGKYIPSFFATRAIKPQDLPA